MSAKLSVGFYFEFNAMVVEQQPSLMSQTKLKDKHHPSNSEFSAKNFALNMQEAIAMEKNSIRKYVMKFV